MRIIQKILFVAIFGWCVGNAKGMAGPALPAAAPVVGTNILDFNTIFNLGLPIPASIRPKIYHPAGYAAAGPNNLKYVYFAIPHNGIIAPANFLRPVNNTAPLNADYNIYFPADGHQPTTPEAVEYSCANVDNREDSPITDWYMQMFGVIPFQNAGAPGQNDYVKAGWSPPASGGGAINAQRIISFHGSVDNTMVNDPNIPGANISRRALFERAFRKIASTSVGRVLLYRILIEIRRHDGLGQNVGILGSDVYNAPAFVNYRNQDRCILIGWSHAQSISFRSAVGIEIFNVVPQRLVIGIRLLSDAVVLQDCSIDVALFHEMLHWYHELRDPNRKNVEKTGQPFVSLHLKDYFIGRYYWDFCSTFFEKDIINSNMLISERNWTTDNNQNFIINNVNFEEMRTIIGVPNDLNFINGDDLFENLYKACIHEPLSCGHGNTSGYEDTRVIDKIIDVCKSNAIFYFINMRNIRCVNTALPPFNGVFNGLGKSSF